MDRLLTKAINVVRNDAIQTQTAMDIIQDTMPKVIWMDPYPMFDREPSIGSGNGISLALGCYRIIDRDLYEETGDVIESTKSIGQGIVKARKQCHKNVFRNGGKFKSKPAGGVTDSPSGRKMYEHNPNQDNWLFSWCDLKNKKLAEQYEKVLIDTEEPEFNDKSMAGK